MLDGNAAKNLSAARFRNKVQACYEKFNLGIDTLVAILLDENSENFIFDENGLSWKNYSISNFEIQKYRQESFISYGSCSFDEPREDLQKLGLL